MDKTTWNAVVIGGSAVAGGVLGGWAWAKLGAAYGMRAGPWGVVAGALVGALAGAALTTNSRGEELIDKIQSDTP